MAISLNNFVYPYFVTKDKLVKKAIKSFPGIYRFSVNGLLKEIKEINTLGLNKILLFGLPGYKDDSGVSAYEEDNIIISIVDNYH